VVLKNGLFQVTNWWHAIFNDNAEWGFPHMWVATFVLSMFVFVGVSAWFILKNRYADLFAKMLKPVVLGLLVVTPLQIYLGDGLGVDVAHSEPTSLAAMEGHYHTYLPNGQPNTAWNLIAIPNAANNGNRFSIQIPHVLSLLETHTWNGVVPGLDQFPANDRPDVWVPFYSFRIMVALGFFLFFMALWGTMLLLRGKLTAPELQKRPWFLRIMIFSAFLPYLAIWTGWWTREVGRQPWVVYGLMRTYEGVSHMSVAEEMVWILGYVVFELATWSGAWYFFTRVIKQGPDLESSIPGSNNTEDESAPAGGGFTKATFAKPTLKDLQ
jgi:cytochrome d ubiquinol oxidase subunit I